MWLNRVACRCAAADPPRKTSYCTALSQTSANTIGPYQYKWISRETCLFPMRARACKLLLGVNMAAAQRHAERAIDQPRGFRARVRERGQAWTSSHRIPSQMMIYRAGKSRKPVVPVRKLFSTDCLKALENQNVMTNIPEPWRTDSPALSNKNS